MALHKSTTSRQLRSTLIPGLLSSICGSGTAQLKCQRAMDASAALEESSACSYCGSGAFRMNGLSGLPASLDDQLPRNSVSIHTVPRFILCEIRRA